MKKSLTISTSILLITVLSACGSGGSSSPTNSSTTYLRQPTGPYGVGFKDYHYINTGICPDPNYVPSENESDFSQGNQGGDGTNYCHEIMARIYYPINNVITSATTPYYPPRVLQLQNALTGAPGITESQIEALPSTLLSWTLPSIPIVSNNFPVILFSPGDAAPAQGYENYITNLVSYGYIVVGINSVFVNGYIQLPDGTIVYNNINQPDSQAISLQESDLQYMYSEINNSGNQSDPIFSKMNLSHIGAYGHSNGAFAIVQIANQNLSWFQSVALMDEGLSSLDQVPDYLKPITNPVLYLMASYTYSTFAQLNIPLQPLVSSTSYRAIITPNLQESTYSTHTDFADDGTLQYNPTIQSYMNAVESYTQALEIGTINGYTMVQYASYDYAIQFFNTFLKNQPNPVFNTSNCVPLSPNTIFTCGPN